ncbi:hypothetical protein BGZ75_001016, partial [Mortierella antarctica]
EGSIVEESTASAGEEDGTDAMDSDRDDRDHDHDHDDNDDHDDDDDHDHDMDTDTEAEEEALASAPVPAHMAVKKRPQTLYQELECHCAMITEELGCLKSIMRRGIFNRYAEASAEQFQDLEQSLLPLAHSAHQFALAAQNMATPHDLLIAAQQAQPAINASKAQYVTVMKELECFAPIGQDLKTRLLEAAIAYHSELVSMVSLSSDPSSSIIPASLEDARKNVQTVLKAMQQQQGYEVADNVVSFIQSIVEDMSDRYRYIQLALQMFVAASVWGAESTARTLEEQTQFDEDLRALLDPRRSKVIARLLGIYLIGEEMDLTKQASARTMDRDRINRIARSAALIFRASITRRLQPIASGQAQIHSQVSTQVAEDFAQHFTTSLSALMAETKAEEADLEGYGDNAIIQFLHLNGTRPQNKRWSYFPRAHLDDRDLSLKNDSLVKALRHRSSPVSGAMATLFGHDKELVFRLFFAPTRHSKTTMSVNNFKQDADGLRMQLEQQWRERKERKEAGTETEFGPRTQSTP